MARSALAADRLTEKPRLLVLTDIGGDPDDQQSMRRLMLYANEFEIAGLVASASGTPGEVGHAVTRPDLIHEIVDDYAMVRANLALHATGYPSAEALHAVIRSGDPNRGVEFIGAGNSTDGSRQIMAAVNATNSLLHVAIWGGAHDLAQALFDVRESRDAAGLAAFLTKLRVYAIADQDKRKAQPGTGEWIRKEFPELRYVEAAPPEIPVQSAVFRGMYQNDSSGGGFVTQALVTDAVALLGQQTWIEANVRAGHGPLGAAYPLVGQNPASPRNTIGLKEGDTPSWFFVLSHVQGLSDAEEPTWGGWGGRFQHDSGGHFIDAEDVHWLADANTATRKKWTVARWRQAYQNDFAARMDWCVQPFAGANHNPVAVLNGDATRRIVRVAAKPGETVRLSADGSRDPDGDTLACRWWHYSEAGSFDGTIEISGSDTPNAAFIAPTPTKPQTIHIIFEVTDSGAPPLTSYRREVVTIAAP